MSALVREHLTGLLVTVVGTVVMALAVGGWSAHSYVSTLATRDEVLLAAGKADYVLDRQIETLVGQISYLERKPNKTAAEVEQLRYLRRQLEQVRKVRDGR